jgi:hypothetical protein
MLLFDIAFAPNQTRCWDVHVPGDGQQSFASREAAIKYAMEQARNRTLQGSTDAFISIEGADGKWRIFDADFKPVAR